MAAIFCVKVEQYQAYLSFSYQKTLKLPHFTEHSQKRRYYLQQKSLYSKFKIFCSLSLKCRYQNHQSYCHDYACLQYMHWKYGMTNSDCRFWFAMYQLPNHVIFKQIGESSPFSKFFIIHLFMSQWQVCIDCLLLFVL